MDSKPDKPIDRSSNPASSSPRSLRDLCDLCVLALNGLKSVNGRAKARGGAFGEKAADGLAAGVAHVAGFLRDVHAAVAVDAVEGGRLGPGAAGVGGGEGEGVADGLVPAGHGVVDG